MMSELHWHKWLWREVTTWIFCLICNVDELIFGGRSNGNIIQQIVGKTAGPAVSDPNVLRKGSKLVTNPDETHNIPQSGTVLAHLLTAESKSATTRSSHCCPLLLTLILDFLIEYLKCISKIIVFYNSVCPLTTVRRANARIWFNLIKDTKKVTEDGLFFGCLKACSGSTGVQYSSSHSMGRSKSKLEVKSSKDCGTYQESVALTLQSVVHSVGQD